MSSFWLGFSAFFQGVGFIVSTPSTWPRAVVPIASFLLLAVTLASSGVWGAFQLSDDPGAWHWAARVVLAIAAVILSLFLALALAQPLSFWALDGIVRAQEIALRGSALPDPPALASIARALGVTLVAVLVAGPLIGGLTLVEVVFPPAMVVCLPLKIMLGALLVSWNLFDYPLAFRELGVRSRLAWMETHLGTVLGFGLAGTLVFLVPGIDLLVLPAGVAGATRAVVQIEAARVP